MALKKPHSVESVKNILRETEFVLEVEEGIPSDNEIRSMKIINHTDKLFWIRSSVGTLINQENLYRLKEVFGEEFDWIGPVYQPLSRRNDRDQLFCPIPNVLVIKLTPGFNDQDDEFLQRLARYNMKEISEKSKYLSGYRYYTIDDIENQNAYQIKDIFLHETQSVQEVLFENMPMIVHADMRPNDPLFPSQWNMNRIQASGAGATAWNFSTGNSSMAICILDSGCDLTHPDLQFSTPGINLGTMSPDGSPITPPPSSNTGSGHGTACAGIVLLGLLIILKELLVWPVRAALCPLHFKTGQTLKLHWESITRRLLVPKSSV